MRTTRSIALTIALAATPLAAAAPTHAAAEAESVATEATDGGEETTDAEPTPKEDEGGDKTGLWGLLGLLGLAGLLGGKKKKEVDVRTADHVRTTDRTPNRTTTVRDDRRDDVVIDDHTRRDGVTDVRREGVDYDDHRRNDGLQGRVDDRFGDGDGRLDGDDLKGNNRR